MERVVSYLLDLYRKEKYFEIIALALKKRL